MYTTDASNPERTTIGLQALLLRHTTSSVTICGVYLSLPNKDIYIWEKEGRSLASTHNQVKSYECAHQDSNLGPFVVRAPHQFLQTGSRTVSGTGLEPVTPPV